MKSPRDIKVILSHSQKKINRKRKVLSCLKTKWSWIGRSLCIYRPGFALSTECIKEVLELSSGHLVILGTSKDSCFSHVRQAYNVNTRMRLRQGSRTLSVSQLRSSAIVSGLPLPGTKGTHDKCITAFSSCSQRAFTLVENFQNCFICKSGYRMVDRLHIV